jgi:hypothetical protein
MKPTLRRHCVTLFCAAMSLALCGAAAAQAKPDQFHLPQSDQTFGLSEEQRQEVFREALAGEERAEKEASEQHRDDPESMKEVEAEESLANQYQDAVARKFALTRKQVVLIVAEGYEKKWSVTPPGREVGELE